MSLLKRYVQDPRYKAPSPVFTDENGIPHWEVAQILATKKVGKNRRQYLVAWTRFGPEYASYVREDILEEGSPELVKDFWQKKASCPELGRVEPEQPKRLTTNRTKVWAFTKKVSWGNENGHSLIFELIVKDVSTMSPSLSTVMARMGC